MGSGRIGTSNDLSITINFAGGHGGQVSASNRSTQDFRDPLGRTVASTFVLQASNTSESIRTSLFGERAARARIGTSGANVAGRTRSSGIRCALGGGRTTSTRVTRTSTAEGSSRALRCYIIARYLTLTCSGYSASNDSSSCRILPHFIASTTVVSSASSSWMGFTGCTLARILGTCNNIDGTNAAITTALVTFSALRSEGSYP